MRQGELTLRSPRETVLPVLTSQETAGFQAPKQKKHRAVTCTSSERTRMLVLRNQL